MCGGFAALVGASGKGLARSILLQLPYSLGRITTYAFFGAVSGFAGWHLSKLPSSLHGAQQTFSILAGALMMLIGLWTLLPIRWRAKSPLGIASLLVPLFSHYLRPNGRSGFFLAGLANGFLPCGLVYAFVVRAVATADAVEGALVMIAFGLGTVPAMMAVGSGAALAGPRTRRYAFRLAACLIMAMGIMSIHRAIAAGSGGSCH